MKSFVFAALVASLALSAPALAQEYAPSRTRVAIGPQLVPSFPGSEKVGLRPYLDVSRARGGETFAFEAPDESTGFTLFDTDVVAVGPAIGFEGKRRRRDVGPGLDTVGFTVEAGGFVQVQVAPAVRVRAELRKGIGGHRGLIGNVGVDYVLRDADRWLVSVGPRATLSDARYNRAYFGVSPAAAVASGLPAFGVGGGLQAVGLTLGALRQIDARWGITGYAKYDRLVDDAARSPVVRTYGSRNQFAGGVSIMRTFGGGGGGAR